MKFLRNVLATIVGLFLFFVIGFFLLILIGALFGSSSEDKVKVKENSVLELKLDFPIKDYAAKTLYDEYPFLFSKRVLLIFCGRYNLYESCWYDGV